MNLKYITIAFSIFADSEIIDDLRKLDEVIIGNNDVWIVIVFNNNNNNIHYYFYMKSLMKI